MQIERGLKRITQLIGIIVGLSVVFFAFITFINIFEQDFIKYDDSIRVHKELLDYWDLNKYKTKEDMVRVLTITLISDEYKYLTFKDIDPDYKDVFDRLSYEAKDIKSDDIDNSVPVNYDTYDTKELMEEIEKIKEKSLLNALNNIKKNKSTFKSPISLLIVSSIVGIVSGIISYVLVWIIFYLLRWLILGFCDDKPID